MRERIQKLAGNLVAIVDLLKSEKIEDAIQKLEEVAGETKDIQKTVDEQENIEKTKTQEIQKKEEELSKKMEEIQKFVSLNISADDMEQALKDIKALNESMKSVSDINKTFEERIAKIEEAKGTSKQLVKKEVSSDDKWASIPL